MDAKRMTAIWRKGEQRARRRHGAPVLGSFVAVVAALLFILQSVASVAHTGRRHADIGERETGFVASLFGAHCAPSPQKGEFPRPLGSESGQCCILCSASDGLAATAIAAPIVDTAIVPSERRAETVWRPRVEDDGRPFGFASSWSPQAPPSCS